MLHPDTPALRVDHAELSAFVDVCGPAWRPRIDAIVAGGSGGARAGRALQQLHAIELTIAKLAQGGGRVPSRAEHRIAALAGMVVALRDALHPAGRQRLDRDLAGSLTHGRSLASLFHRMSIADLQRSRGFRVAHAGLADAAPFDLLLARDGVEAELACETVHADEGRDLHRTAWFDLIDGIDPDLQTWLSAHPGRYLLKMTLPQGLRASDDSDDGGMRPLAELQRRIRDMLSRQRRADSDEAAVLRMDPLLLAGAQAGELGLLDALRRQFGPEAQLAVTRSGAGVCVMAARAGRANDIGAAVRRGMARATPTRFTGARPGILAMFLEATDKSEWQDLRDGLQLEAEARQFLTDAAAGSLVAVTASSRIELFSATAENSEMRFRNPAHPAAGSAALAPAVRSTR